MNTVPFDREKYRAEKAEREARFSALEPFEQFKAVFPDRHGEKQGMALAEYIFGELTSERGYPTRIYDKFAGMYRPRRWSRQDPDFLIERARAYAKRIAEQRLSGAKEVFVMNADRWLNDGEWQS